MHELTEARPRDIKGRDATIAFRLPGDLKLLVQAVAIRRGIFPSDFLREITKAAIRQALAEIGPSGER